MGNTARRSEAEPDGTSEREGTQDVEGTDGGLTSRTAEPAETSLAKWYTEEIEEALTKALHPGLYETDGLLHPALALSGQWQARHKVRAALDAIAPMVLDLLDEEYAKGYSDAYWNEDDKGVTE